MKTKTIIALTISLLASQALVSCVENDETAIVNCKVTIKNTFPEVIPADAKIIDGKATFYETNSGTTYARDLNSEEDLMLPVGLYNVEARATAEYVNPDELTVEKNIRASASAVVIQADTEIPLEWFITMESSSFIFSEMYHTGSLNAAGTGGLYDHFFRIYNNTDEVLYADGLGIAESSFTNTKTTTYEILTEANDRNVNFTAQAIWVIPGNGTDVPVQPGESLLIVDQAIDWSAQVEGALDLSHADFEWWDDNPRDTDNPEVPNLEKWYSYSLTIWLTNNQCTKSYALVRFPEGMTSTDYLANYRGSFDYISAIGTYMTNDKSYLIPNEWIIDGVNLSNKEQWLYGALSPQIDISYASISDIERDPNRFGWKHVRRVASTAPDGRKTLLDTNDSATDFILKRAKE